MRTQDRFGDVPVRDAYLESNHQETSGALELRDSLQNKLLVIFNHVVKVQERIWNITD